MAFSNAYTIVFAAGICVVCSITLASLSMGLKDLQDDNRRRDLYKNILAAADLPPMEYEENGKSCTPTKDNADTCLGERPDLSGDEVDALWTEKIELLAIDPKSGVAVDAAEADQDGNGVFDFLDLKAANDDARRRKKAGDDDAVPAILGVYRRKDTKTIVVPMAGKGLWGPISAYVALDTELENVTGTRFFAPKETPGLGAEITNSKFLAQWPGKTIGSGKTVSAIRVLKPSECDEKVDQTCVDGVSGATITSRGVDAMMADTLALYTPYIQKERR